MIKNKKLYAQQFELTKAYQTAFCFTWVIIWLMQCTPFAASCGLLIHCGATADPATSQDLPDNAQCTPTNGVSARSLTWDYVHMKRAC